MNTTEHPIERIMQTAMTKIKTLVDADTIVGNAITTADGVSIIPISKLSLGFMTGGGEYGDTVQHSKDKSQQYPFAGGSGAGVSVSPIGFLISDGKTIKMVSIDDKNPVDKLIDLIPEVISSIVSDDKKH